MYKYFIVAFLFMVSGLSAQSIDTKGEKLIDGILKKMTLDEKIGQLNLPSSGDVVTGQAKSSDIAKKIKEGKVGGLFNIRTVDKIREVQRIAVEDSRLGIPLIFGMDVIHGYESVFPIPLALSCTWNLDLIKKSARIAATEASADGINWTFSPMVDICRDPRWGRMAEGNGEDPFLGYHISNAIVKGYQGDDLKAPNTILSCVKHFALYGASESGRDYNTTDMSRIRMYNDYFPPYKGAIDAGVGSVMASFNEIDGIPATGNKWLLTDVLRKQWGFKGFILSDYTAVGEMVEHGIGDLSTCSAQALDAGIDMDMVSEGILTTIKSSLAQKKITEKQINEACRRILEAKYKLGLFEDPYRYCNADRAKKEIFTKDHRTAARNAGPESFVLLKNEGNILPLKKSGTIALVGPLADNKENMPGTWSVAARYDKAVSLLSGMKELVGDKVKIIYARGSNLDQDSIFEENAGMFGKSLRRDSRSANAMINEALAAAAQADVIVAAVGESSEMSGESSSRADIGIPQVQLDLLDALRKTGKPVVVVLFAGRPMEIKWADQYLTTILNVWFPGSEAGYSITDALFGDEVPSGKLTATWPQHQGQIPIYYSVKNTGRPLGNNSTFTKFRSNYLDVSNEPLYPFGFGLSYTTFEYGKMKLSSVKLKGSQSLKATVSVKNTGAVKAKEIVQLYIRDVVGSVTRPLKELKGFEKIELSAGQSKEVSFEITPELLKFYNYDLKHDWEAGEFDIMIGSDSKQLQVQRVMWDK